MESTIKHISGANVGKLVSNTEDVQLTLAPNTVFRMDGDRRGSTIVCLKGNLWVTQQGDAADYLLGAGERLVVSRRGTVLVQGISEAKTRIIPRLN